MLSEREMKTDYINYLQRSAKKKKKNIFGRNVSKVQVCFDWKTTWNSAKWKKVILKRIERPVHGRSFLFPFFLSSWHIKQPTFGPFRFRTWFESGKKRYRCETKTWNNLSNKKGEAWFREDSILAVYSRNSPPLLRGRLVRTFCIYGRIRVHTSLVSPFSYLQVVL